MVKKLKAKKVLKLTGIIFIGIILISIGINSLNKTEEKVNEEGGRFVEFNFYVNETGERLNGEVFLNKSSGEEIFIGNTENGKISLEKNKLSSGEIAFFGEHNKSKFGYYYELTEEVINLGGIDYIITEKELSELESAKDYYSDTKEIHWKNMPITYSINNPEVCGEKVVNQIRWAFEAIQNETNQSVRFENKINNGKINVTCYTRYGGDTISLTSRTQASTDYWYLIENPNIVTNAEINLYKITTGNYFGRCGKNYPSPIVSQILVAFGFKMNGSPSSIMYKYIDGCTEKIDDKIIEQLKEIYS